MHLDVTRLYLMADRTEECIALIAFVIFVLTFSAIYQYFCQRKRLVNLVAAFFIINKYAVRV